MNLSELFEARRNPDQNPSITLRDALSPYRGDKDVFVSFVKDVGLDSHIYQGNTTNPESDLFPIRDQGRNTSGTKIGVNPQTEFLTTPGGVFVYPLNSMFEEIVSGKLPYASGRPYAYVIRAKGRILDLTEYSQDDLRRDVDRLRPVIASLTKKLGHDVSPDDLINYWAANTSRNPKGQPNVGPGAKFWAITNGVATLKSEERHGLDDDGMPTLTNTKSKPWVWNGVLRALGYDAVLDHGDGIIHGHEPAQAVFLSKNGFEVLDLVMNKRDVTSLGEEIVMEVDWYDRSEITDVLKSNKGRWIHFSKIPKLGVNIVAKSHQDPVGTYFYPVDWLLSGDSRLMAGQQYALDFPYYFTADISLDSNGLTLSKTTWEQVEAIAKRNGWYDRMVEYRNDPKSTPGFSLPYYAKPDMPGSFLWHFVDALQKEGFTTWNRAFKGLSYIYDDNNSIIHSNEPAQIIVFDPRLIRNTAMGDNKVSRAERHDVSSWLALRRPIMMILQQLQKKFDGTIKWVSLRSHRYDRASNKTLRTEDALPMLTFETNGKKIVLKVKNSHWGPEFDINYSFDNISGNFDYSNRDIQNNSIEDIVNDIIEGIDNKTKNRFNSFKPLVTVEEAKDWLRTNTLARQFETEFDNNDLKLIVKSKIEFGGTDFPVTSEVRIEIFEDRIAFDIDTSKGIFDYVLNFRVHESFLGESITKFTDLTQAVFLEFKSRLPNLIRAYGPNNSGAYKFYTEDDLNVFIGWIILNSPIPLNGYLTSYYDEYVAAYNADEAPLNTVRLARLFKR